MDPFFTEGEDIRAVTTELKSASQNGTTVGIWINMLIYPVTAILEYYLAKRGIKFYDLYK